MRSLRSRAYLGLVLLVVAVAGMALVGDLRAHTYPYLALYALAAAGYLLAIADIRTLPLPAIIAGGLIIRALLFPGEPTLSDDYHRYLWDGRVQTQGINPYLHAPSSADLDEVHYPERHLINHPDVRTIYPALSELLFHALARVGASTVAALKMVFGLFDLAVAVLLWYATGARRREALALYLLHPMVAQEIWGSAHLDAAPTLLVVAAALLIARGRDLGGGLALGLGAAFKLYPGFLLISALVGGRARPLPTLGGFALGFGLPYLPYLWTGEVLGSLRDTSTELEFHSSVFYLLRFVLPYSTARVVVIATFVALALALAVRRRGRGNTMWVFAATSTLLVLLLPVVHPWYWVTPVALGALAGMRLPVLLGLASPASYVTYAEASFRQRLWARLLSYSVLAAPSADLKAMASEAKKT